MFFLRVAWRAFVVKKRGVCRRGTDRVCFLESDYEKKTFFGCHSREPSSPVTRSMIGDEFTGPY